MRSENRREDGRDQGKGQLRLRRSGLASTPHDSPILSSILESTLLQSKPKSNHLGDRLHRALEGEDDEKPTTRREVSFDFLPSSVPPPQRERDTHLKQLPITLTLVLPDILEPFRNHVGHVKTFVLALVRRRSGHPPKETAFWITEFLCKVKRSFRGFEFLDDGLAFLRGVALWSFCVFEGGSDLRRKEGR